MQPMNHMIARILILSFNEFWVDGGLELHYNRKPDIRTHSFIRDFFL